MVDLTLINEKVCKTLREENNEITYKAWLFFTENAQLIDDDIVILVPNQFIKNVMEERYLDQLEELYRSEFEFKKFIIKVMAEEENKRVNECQEKRSVGDQLVNKLDDFVVIINTHIKNIYNFIEAASMNGSSFISYSLSDELFRLEEIYWEIKEFMLNRGFKVELSSLDGGCTLNLSW